MTNRPSVVVAALATIAMTVGVAATGSTASSARNGQIAWKSFPHAGSQPGRSTPPTRTAPTFGDSRIPEPASRTTCPTGRRTARNILFQRILQPQASAADGARRDHARATPTEAVCVRSARAPAPASATTIRSTPPTDVGSSSREPLRVKASATPSLGVWVMDANGSNARQITQLANSSSSEDHEPAWSPDGKSIVFTRLNDTAAPTNEQALFVVAKQRRNGAPDHAVESSTPAARTGPRRIRDPVPVLPRLLVQRDLPGLHDRPRRHSAEAAHERGLEHRAELVARRHEGRLRPRAGNRPGRTSRPLDDGRQRQAQAAGRPDQPVGERTGLGNRADHPLVALVAAVARRLRARAAAWPRRREAGTGAA